jgi:hypothetical protein
MQIVMVEDCNLKTNGTVQGHISYSSIMALLKEINLMTLFSLIQEILPKLNLT